MHAMEYSDSFLLSQFREFYSEVVRLKQMVHSGTWVYSSDEEETAEEHQSPLRATTAVWQRLLTTLEQQALLAGRRGGEYGAMLYKEAQYVMAALADEIFIHLDWEGREAWKAHLLETKLFDSHNAGEHIFDKIEHLLLEHDPVYRELAKVYLMVLALDFQGKFRGTDDGEKIDHYRRQLFAFISRRQPNLLNASRPLFPEAYSHTLDSGQARKLPDARKWFALLAGVLLVWIVLSSGLWKHLTAELQSVINQINGNTPMQTTKR
jgi:type VI secretion system protein ImpK